MLPQLNRQQRAAVEAIGPVLVAAPPGSGKTKVLVSRIQHLLSLAPHARIVAVTFTRDSADELLHRLGGDSARSGQVKSGTFHSLAKQQLEKAGVKVDLLDDGMRFPKVISALRQVKSAAGWDVYDAMRVIDGYKAKWPRPKDDGSVEALLVQAYQRELDQGGGADFNDLLSRSVMGMEAGTIPALPCDHMLVDEFQDIDELQLGWVHCYMKAGVQIFAVADDDQSIYAFRSGLGYSGMMRLEQLSGAIRVVLTDNYRSKGLIVSQASELISKNTARVPKRIQAARGAGGGICVIHRNSAEAEAEACFQGITSVPGTWGILARNRALLYGVQAFLTSAGVPHKSIGKSVWEEQAGKLFLAAVAMVAGSRVTAATRDSLLIWAGGTEQEVQTLRSMQPAAVSSGLPAPSSTMGAGVLRQWLELFPNWQSLAADDDTLQLALLGVTTWLTKGIKQNSHLSSQDAGRASALTKVCAAALGRMDGPLRERVKWLRNFRGQKEEGPPPLITLSTMHGSKGLEFDNVWILGAEAKVIPDEKSSQEEERRLFYVAVTRAKDSLTMSCRGGMLSPFIDEMLPAHAEAIMSGKLMLGDVPAPLAQLINECCRR